MRRRDILSILLLIFVIAFPYWIYGPAIVLAIIFVPLYWEIIILGFLIDVLYGVKAHPGISVMYPHALLSAGLVLLFIPLREYLRFDRA